MAKKKQQGGYLKGAPHNTGGVNAVIAGKEPVELEGGEYIMSVDATNSLLLIVDLLDSLRKVSKSDLVIEFS